MTDALLIDWPDGVDKPPLPEGYEWVCLSQAYGLKNADGNHPWWIRFSWRTKRGYQRIVRMPYKFFETSKDAIDEAIREANLHQLKRLK